MGEEAVLLRNVGLGSVADVLDEFDRQVLELNNEMSGKVSARASDLFLDDYYVKDIFFEIELSLNKQESKIRKFV